MKCLDELRICCDYSHGGCHEVVQLAHLQDHIDVSGFAPAKCHNEGCLAKLTRQELAAHQQAFCEFRKCCDCSELKKVVHEINVNTNEVKKQIKDLTNMDEACMLAVKDEVSKTKEDINQVLNRLGALEEQVRATKETQEVVKEAHSLNNKKIQAQNILVVGGRRTDFGEMKYVELFNVYGMTWSSLQQMSESRVGASVVKCL